MRDATGAAIPVAKIALRNLTTNQIRNLTTDSEGHYRAAGLAVGDYEVKVEATGFGPYFNPRVTLALGHTSTLEVSLAA